MKVAIVGSGVQGSALALILAKDPEVSEIVCSDVKVEKARKVAQKLAESGKVIAKKADASNVGELVETITGADIVINATLPRYNLNVMDAALKCGAHYIDLLAGFELLERPSLDEEFKNEGLTAAIGQGGPHTIGAPVREVVDGLDELTEIHLRFGWRSTLKPKPVPVWSPGWSPEMALLEWAEEPVVYERGVFKRLPRFSGIEEYPFPEPVGPSRFVS